MIKYAEFEADVITIAGNIDEWRHLLPAIPYAHRRRYIITLQNGFDMPTSFDMVMASQKLMEDEYNNYMAEAQLAKDTINK